MVPPEDARTPSSTPSSDEEVLEQMRQERALLAEERRALREERRRQDRQFLGIVLICAVLFLAVGVGLAMVVWRPGPTTDPAGANEGPGPVAAEPAATDLADPPAVGGGNPGPAVRSPAGGEAAANDISLRSPVCITDKESFISHMVGWRGEERKYLEERWNRYQACLELGDLTEQRVKEAFLATPREKFCRPWNLDRAYEHAFLDIHHGVTISGPHIVARMTNALNPQPEHKCLEIGTGSGYQAAMLANLSNHVYSIEIIAPLAEETQGIYEELRAAGYDEYKNVHLKAADGYYGWEEYAPFDRIIVTCGIDHIPPPLVKQLAPNGVIIIPIGTPNSQEVLKITKKVGPDGEVDLSTRENLYPGRTKPIVFVPFTAEGGGTHYR